MDIGHTRLQTLAFFVIICDNICNTYLEDQTEKTIMVLKADMKMGVWF